jgi:hypothetical protein
MLKHARIPKFSSKYSPKKYTQHQHTVILILKKYFKSTYRDVTDILEEMPRIRELIDLITVPHFTTIQKFFDRIMDSMLYSLLMKITEAFIIAVDSTGFSSHYASKYYEKMFFKDVQRRRFQKMAVAVDTRKQMIMNVFTEEGPTYDYRNLIPLLQPLKAKYVVADKGYDSEKNIQFVIDKNSIPLIRIRGKPRRGLRKKTKQLFYKHVKYYRSRSKVETVFSVIKKKFGEHLYSRKLLLRNKEIVLNGITYNAYKEIYCLIMNVFYRTCPVEERL